MSEVMEQERSDESKSEAEGTWKRRQEFSVENLKRWTKPRVDVTRTEE
jgi:hypothetical protein